MRGLKCHDVSRTLLRLGLWIIIATLALYVVREYPDSPVTEFVPAALLQKALVLGALVIVAGVIVRILAKGAKVVVKPRCSVCRTPVPHGAIYCRAHLRTILHDEDDRTHTSRL